MGKRTSYEPGTFSWTDLGTTDPEAAKSFYGELFGWQADDMPAGEGMTYTMMRVDGDYVAGLSRQMDAQREAGVPPNWFNYVTVASADDAAARVNELGGTVHAPPFDVLDSGRMAVIADPTGAMFGIWEPRQHIGAQRVNDPGCMTWNELATSDPTAAQDFYSNLFGWRFEAVDTGDGPPYWTISHDGGAASRNGGMRQRAPEEGGMSYWVPYFTVESADDAAARVGELGGQVHVDPFDLPTGARIAVLGDPQGAVFCVFEGEIDD